MIKPSFTIDSSSINAVKAKVEIYDGSTLVTTCTCSDFLQNFTMDRIGENNKFFGFGICHKLTVTLIDLERVLNVAKGQLIKVAYGDGENFLYPYPELFIDEVTRDENTNDITLVAYDKLYAATTHQSSELNLTAPYYLLEVPQACIDVLGIPSCSVLSFPYTHYPEGANFDGTESLREVLNAMAEATQTIYYIDSTNTLRFKKLYSIYTPVLTISKDNYFSLKTGSNVTLEAICHMTELGDNVTVGTEGGVTQYVRNNPFWELRSDIDSLLNTAASLLGLSINQFACESWEGNYCLEIGDKIEIITQDGSSLISYVLNDSITFDGTLSESTQWMYEPNDSETTSNPVSLGEKLNQTFARVDKANQEIELLISDTSNIKSDISTLQLTTQGITASVSSLETEYLKDKDAVNEIIAELYKQVDLKMSADEVNIAISSSLAKGVDKVTTTTGYTFDAEGLKVNKSDSEISTTITEDGMRIDKSGEEVLVANNQGVSAENLHATTYILIGSNSRFENFGSERTACFWIGE